MVFYFTTSDGTMVYMGKDKHENELLIKWGWPEDVWFHVDDMSSAHVYLRLPKGTDWTDISEDALEECCQLVKANSIKGSKIKNVKIVYTPWANLRKTKSMEVGQVGFHKPSQKQYRTVSRDKDILRALAKTKTWVEEPDLEGQRRARDAVERKKLKAERQEEAAAAAQARKDMAAQADLRSYKSLFAQAPGGGRGAELDEDLFGDEIQAAAAAGGGGALTSVPTVDQAAAEDWEEDFM